MLEHVIAVSLETVVGEAAKIKIEGYRFVTMSCTELDGDSVDILYHFDKNLELKHFRLTVGKEGVVPSISPVYFAAFLVENEIQDLFGVRFSGLAVDYERTFYLDEEVKGPPFCRYTVSESQKETPISTPATGGS